MEYRQKSSEKKKETKEEKRKGEEEKRPIEIEKKQRKGEDCLPLPVIYGPLLFALRFHLRLEYGVVILIP